MDPTSPPTSRLLSRMAGADRGRLPGSAFLILPLGATEYHGPHAPLGLDSTVARGLAEALAQRRDALVLPAIDYSFTPLITSPELGSLSVSAATFLPYLTDVLRAVFRSGARRLLALNAHSENQFSLRLAAEQVALEFRGASVLMVDWWKLLPATAPDGGAWFPGQPGNGHGHGGPVEVSVSAAFDQAGVAPSLSADIPYESPWWAPAARVVGAGQAPEGFRGYHGAVSSIDAIRGREMVDAVVQVLERLVDDWLQRADGAETA